MRPDLWALAAGIEEKIAAAWGASGGDSPRLEELATRAAPQLIRQLEEYGRRARIWRAPDGVTISSSALGGCARSLAFELEGVERDPFDAPRISPALRLKFALGDAGEALACLALEAAGLRLRGACTSPGRQEEVSAPLGERAWALGHPDGRVTIPGYGEALIEVKTADLAVFASWVERASSRGSRGADGDWSGYPLSPVDRYWWQVQAYLRGAGLDLALLVAICRDSGELRVFPIPLDVATYERAGGAWARAIAKRQRVTAGGADLSPTRRGRGECAFCPWARPCAAEEGRQRIDRQVAAAPAGREDHGVRVCDCGRPIEWILTAKGKSAPVELERVKLQPSKTGALTGYTDAGTLVRGDYPEPGAKGAHTVRLAHFSRCPQAGKFRRGK